MNTSSSRWIAWILLVVALAGMALASAVGLAMSRSSLQGVGAGYRYYALGIRQSGGTTWALSAKNLTVLRALHGLLPPRFAVSGSMLFGCGFLDGKDFDPVILPSRLCDEFIGEDYFSTLHVSLLAGRTHSRHGVYVSAALVHALGWPIAAAVGRTLRFKSLILIVAGVVPATFHGLAGRREPTNLWFPSELYGRVITAEAPGLAPGFAATLVPSDVRVVLSAPQTASPRFVRGVMDRAQDELIRRGALTLGQMLITRTPFSLAPLRQQQAMRALRLYLLLAFAALAFALLNVLSQESLVVVRERQRFELHRLLGATRAWLLSTYALRSLVRGSLVFAGSLLLSIAGWWILHRVLPAAKPWNQLRFGMVLSELAWILPVAVTLVMGVAAVPLLGLRQREDLQVVLRTAMRDHAARWAAPVIVLELAVLFVLINLAIWSGLSWWQARHADLGLLTHPVSWMTVRLVPGKGAVMPQGRRILIPAEHAIHTLWPGHCLASGRLPAQPADFGPIHYSLQIKGKTYRVENVLASPGFFRCAGGRILAGSDFARESSTLKVLITANLAKAVYGSVPVAVGQPLPMTSALAGRLPFVVRGVVANVHFHGWGRRPGFYFFQDQRLQSLSPSSTTLVVAPALSAAKLGVFSARIDEIVKRINPNLEVAAHGQSAALRAQLDVGQTRVVTVTSIVAVLGALLALTGVTAQLRLYLAMRKHLRAIRSALGAGPGRLYHEVVWGVLALAGVGTVLALLATPWLAQQFAFLSGTQVSPFGGATWIALAMLLLAVFAVVHLPARRAAWAEPAESLHEL